MNTSRNGSQNRSQQLSERCDQFGAGWLRPTEFDDVLIPGYKISRPDRSASAEGSSQEQGHSNMGFRNLETEGKQGVNNCRVLGHRLTPAYTRLLQQAALQ